MRLGSRTSPPSEADTAILAHKLSATRTQAREQVWCEKPWRAELVVPAAPFPPAAQRPRAAPCHCTGQGQRPSGGLGTPHTTGTLQVFCCESWRAPSRMHAVGVSAEHCFAAAPCPQCLAGWCSGAGRCVQPVPPSLGAGALCGAMSAALSLLIALRSLLHFIVSDKQPSPEDMSERCWLLVQRGKHSLSPSVARALRCSNALSLALQPPRAARGAHYACLTDSAQIPCYILSRLPQMLCKQRNKNLQHFQSEKRASFQERGIFVAKVTDDHFEGIAACRLGACPPPPASSLQADTHLGGALGARAQPPPGASPGPPPGGCTQGLPLAATGPKCGDPLVSSAPGAPVQPSAHRAHCACADIWAVRVFNKIQTYISLFK